MPAVIRIVDPIDCGDSMGNGSPNVFANNIPVSRLGVDLTAGHCYSPTPIIAASPNVYVNNIPVNRVGDPIQTHCCPGSGCHGGNAAAGSPNVFINDGNAPTVRVAVPKAVTQQQQAALDDYVSNPTKYRVPPKVEEDDQIKRDYPGTVDTSSYKTDPAPEPANPPSVPTPNETGNKWSFVGGNQSVKSFTNNPSGGGVTNSYPAGWTTSKGQIDAVIRVPNGAAVISILSQCLAERNSWLETGMGGAPSNRKITNIWREIGMPSSGIWLSDQTAWCAGFVQYILKQAGLKWMPEAGARNTIANAAKIGGQKIPITDMQPGDIVLWSYSHVNFCYNRFS
jgi:cell wall-associated NlpC family hydrolase